MHKNNLVCSFFIKIGILITSNFISFQEMVQNGNAVKPDMTVLVLDASIGILHHCSMVVMSDDSVRSGR